MRFSLARAAYSDGFATCHMTISSKSTASNRQMHSRPPVGGSVRRKLMLTNLSYTTCAADFHEKCSAD